VAESTVESGVAPSIDPPSVPKTFLRAAGRAPWDLIHAPFSIS